MQFETIRIKLPLKKKFTVSQGSAEEKTNILIILNNRYSGEAASSIYYGPNLKEIEEDIALAIEKLQQIDKIDARTLVAIGQFDIHPIARSAIVGMVLHYLSGESERYPWEVLGLGTPVGIKSSFTVGIDSPELMSEAIGETESPIIKIKMGSENDHAIIEELKKIEGKDIRVDANGGWSLEQAEEMIFKLNNIGIKIIEQPTKPEFIEEWPMLKGKATDVELIIDEGLEQIDDYRRYSEYIDGVNIKMEKSGGIIVAKAIAEAAREDNKKVMLGCMIESSVGISQSVYLSSLADYCDLDSPQHLESDIASGIRYQNERIEVDREIIGGPKLIRDVLERFIQK